MTWREVSPRGILQGMEKAIECGWFDWKQLLGNTALGCLGFTAGE